MEIVAVPAFPLPSSNKIVLLQILFRILFLAWVTLKKHRWVAFAERRGSGWVPGRGHAREGPAGGREVAEALRPGCAGVRGDCGDGTVFRPRGKERVVAMAGGAARAT